MTKTRVTARDQIRVASQLLDLPSPFTRQVAARMKSDGRLPATRPIAAAVTAQHLARLVLGLCAPIPSKSTDLETTLGALPRTGGDGAATLAQELEDIITEAVGDIDGDIDFAAGDVLIGITNPVVLVTVEYTDGRSSVRTYRANTTPTADGMTKFARIPLRTLRLLALELMGE